MSLFQNITYDNFFHNPEKIIDLSKNIKFEKSKCIKGSRTKSLYHENKELWEFINLKILSFYFPNIENIMFSADTHFQKSVGDINDGWIHTDKGLLTGIIYLNKEGTVGTSIYKKKNEFDKIPQKDKHDYFLNSEKYNLEQKSIILQQKIKNNNKFTKTAFYSGEYNRLLCFNSSTPHASDLLEENKERLIIITFIYRIFTDFFPSRPPGFMSDYF